MEGPIWLYFNLQKTSLKEIKLQFLKGNHERDFTHVDFIADSIIGLINKPPKKYHLKFII